MSTYGLQFAINRTFFGYGVDVYQKDPKGTISIAKNVEMQEMTEAEEYDKLHRAYQFLNHLLAECNTMVSILKDELKVIKEKCDGN